MAEQHRKTKARAAANKYAPKPEGSALTYGVVGVLLAIMALVVFGLFYRADVFANPLVVGLALVVVFVFSMLLRQRRKRLHRQAYEQELERHDNSPPGK